MPMATVSTATQLALLRWRRARELEMRRELTVCQAQRSASRRDLLQAEATRRRTESALAQSRGERLLPGARLTAGRMAHRESFELMLGDRLMQARLAEKKARAKLDRVEHALSDAQRALSEAVLARQRSEAMQATERALAARGRERRENADAEDRFRPGLPRSRRRS